MSNYAIPIEADGGYCQKNCGFLQIKKDGVYCMMSGNQKLVSYEGSKDRLYIERTHQCIMFAVSVFTMAQKKGFIK